MNEQASPLDEEIRAVSVRRRRLRWWFAIAVLLLIVAYPLSEGPIYYARARGWIPPWTDALYLPLDLTLQANPVFRPRLQGVRREYRASWWNYAQEHEPLVTGIGGPCGKIRLMTDREDIAARRTIRTRSLDFRWVFDFDNVPDIVIERRFTYPAGASNPGVAHEGRVRFGERVLAKIPENAKLIEIEYFEGTFEIEIDGQSVPVAE